MTTPQSRDAFDLTDDKPGYRYPPDLDDGEALPPTFFEVQQQRNEKEMALNDRRERRRLFESNRKAGHPEPKVGDRMWISVNSTLTPRRTRAGIMFEKGARVQVEVVDMSDADLAALRAEARATSKPNPPIVTRYGAEQILADDALNVHKHDAAVLGDNEKLRAANAQIEEELRAAREELRALRAARMSAPESPTGAPARLQAAAAAKAGKPAPTAPPSDVHGDFGPTK
jgi:hypothetical protein